MNNSTESIMQWYRTQFFKIASEQMIAVLELFARTYSHTPYLMYFAEGGYCYIEYMALGPTNDVFSVLPTHPKPRII